MIDTQIKSPVDAAYVDEAWRNVSTLHSTSKGAIFDALFALRKKATEENHKPAPKPVTPENIPSTLRKLDQWVIWRYEQNGTRWTKVPYIADGVSRASSTNPSTWRDFDCCLRQYQSGRSDGIGFMFREGDGLAGIDLDHCFDGQDFKPEAKAILDKFEGSAYAERSPGGDGVRLFVLGAMPRSGKGKGPLSWIEGYDYRSPRYLTVTGHRLEGISAEEPDTCQDELNWFHETYLRQAEVPLPDGAEPSLFDAADEVEDSWLIDRIRHSPSQGDRFAQLFDAGTLVDRETGEVVTDQSSLDMKLIEMLAFWCSRDRAQMDRIFRSSALMRAKWVERRGVCTYGEITIDKGIKYNAEHGGRAFKDSQPAVADIDKLPQKVRDAVKAVARRCQLEPAVFAMLTDLKPAVLQQCIDASAQVQSTNRFVIVTAGGDYRTFLRGDFISALSSSVSPPYSRPTLTKLLKGVATKERLTVKDTEGLLKEFGCVIDEAILDHVLVERQFGNMAVKVDMFAKKSSIRLHDGCAYVTFTHLKFPEGPVDRSVIDDFREHWPHFDRFIELIAAARFAAARKKAYLWLRADSDFGKGLLEGALDALGLVVSMTTQEVEKVFGGGPVGRQMNEFRRAWVLLFNEFKSNKAELKQLEQTISFSPKNLPVCKAEIFLKLFTSAEAVESLVSEASGVEDQFANRFSLIQATGRIDDRPIFTASRERYRESLTNYIAGRLNRLVDSYVAKGRREAANCADRYVIEFHQEFGIGNKFERLSGKLKGLAHDHLQWLASEYLSAKDKSTVSSSTLSSTERRVLSEVVLRKRPLGEQDLLVKQPAAMLDLWLEGSFNRAERGKLTVKTSDIKAHLPPCKPHSVNNLKIRAMHVGRITHKGEFISAAEIGEDSTCD